MDLSSDDGMKTAAAGNENLQPQFFVSEDGFYIRFLCSRRPSAIAYMVITLSLSFTLWSTRRLLAISTLYPCFRRVAYLGILPGMGNSPERLIAVSILL